MGDQVPACAVFSSPTGTHSESFLHSPRRSGYQNMSSRDSYDEKSDVKSTTDVVDVHATHHLAFKTSQVDTGAQLVAGEHFELDPAEATRIRRKIDWHILPLMCSESVSSKRCCLPDVLELKHYTGSSSWIKRRLVAPLFSVYGVFDDRTYDSRLILV